MSPRDPMDGLSKEERRRRALEMLKAKRPTTATSDLSAGRTDADGARARELEARERELEERARRLEELERRLEAALERAESTNDAPDAPATAPPNRQSAARAERQHRRPSKAAQLPVSEDREGEAANETPNAKVEAAATKSRARLHRVRERGSAPTRAEAAESPPPAPERARKAPTPSTGVLLDVRDMNVHYGQIQALRDVNIRISSGDVVALLGANGAGKSSTLKAIAGVVSPSGGDILFEGESIAGLPAQEVVKRGIALVPEGRELFPTLTVEENLRLGYWPRRQEKSGLKKAYDHVYAMFPRLAERRTQAAGTMSGGEQQMLVFGRALMSRPKLLLADEMSLGLAPLIVRTLFEAIEVIHQEGASVIIVEQFVHQALRHAQRAYVLAKGEITLDAPSSKLANDPKLLAAYLGGAEGHIEEEAVSAAKPGARAKSGRSGSATRKPDRAKQS